MKVLLTGAAGYIGSTVARELEKKNDVRGVDMRPISELNDSRVVDLNSYDAVYEALAGIDTVAHLAWPLSKSAESAIGDHSHLGVGVRGTFHLLKAVVARGVERVVFQSTINITNPSQDAWRLTEDELPQPTHEYEVAKSLAEELCRSFARVHPLTIAVIRFGGVFTLEEEGFEFAAPHRHPIPSTCVERRDIAQAYHLALTRPLPSRFEIFHIFHERPGDRFPIEKAKRILGYKPRYNCEELWRR